MDPRGLEIADIVKLFPTEEALLRTTITRDDVLYISKEPFTIYYRKNNGDLRKVTRPMDMHTLISESGLVSLEFIGEGDDKGIFLRGGQLTVGTASQGEESVFGRGDSFPVPIAYHCQISNTVGQVITGAIDVSTILQSDADSTTGLFGGNLTGDYLLVGSSTKFGGAKMKYTNLGDVNPENLVSEYLEQEGGDWIPVPFMATQADPPLEQYAYNIASVNSEHVRFGFNPLRPSGSTLWELATLTINGEEITAYWGRFRLMGDITEDPTTEQLKLHPARFEINENGMTEYFGDARYLKLIPAERSANANKTPTNHDVAIAPGITEVLENNEFNNSANDGFILRGSLPVGADTSVPFIIEVDWFPNTALSGDVEIQFAATAVPRADSEFLYNGTQPILVETEYVETIDVNEQYKKHTATFLVPAVRSLPGDLIYASIFRDASPANIHDTLAGSIVVTDVRVFGYFWKP